MTIEQQIYELKKFRAETRLFIEVPVAERIAIIKTINQQIADLQASA